MDIDCTKCEHFKKFYETNPNGYGKTYENYCFLYKDKCDKYPQCIYRNKEIQQLKAENEKLKEKYNSIYDYLQEREKLINTQIVELFKLKAENEKLRNLQVGFCQGEKLYNLYSYKQCLEEIKEIAIKQHRSLISERDCISCDDRIKAILDKVSEVINGNS